VDPQWTKKVLFIRIWISCRAVVDAEVVSLTPVARQSKHRILSRRRASIKHGQQSLIGINQSINE
jgi:hypothetical protein